MSNIFDITDKTGRKIILSSKTWSHIREEHPNVEDSEEIIESLRNADKIIDDEREGITYYYKYFKNKKQTSKFLKVVVKYINIEGNILSAYFVRNPI